jgi:hypothetical protein
MGANGMPDREGRAARAISCCRGIADVGVARKMPRQAWYGTPKRVPFHSSPREATRQRRGAHVEGPRGTNRGITEHRIRYSSRSAPSGHLNHGVTPSYGHRSADSMCAGTIGAGPIRGCCTIRFSSLCGATDVQRRPCGGCTGWKWRTGCPHRCGAPGDPCICPFHPVAIQRRERHGVMRHGDEILRGTIRATFGPTTPWVGW